MADLIELSKEAIKMLLAGDDELFKTLRMQYETCEMTIGNQIDTGVYIDLNVDHNIPPVNPEHLHINDVYLSQENLKYPIGFILFVDLGYLAFLELYAYEKLPKEFINYTFYYSETGEIGDGKRRKWHL